MLRARSRSQQRHVDGRSSGRLDNEPHRDRVPGGVCVRHWRQSPERRHRPAMDRGCRNRRDLRVQHIQPSHHGPREPARPSAATGNVLLGRLERLRRWNAAEHRHDDQRRGCHDHDRIGRGTGDRWLRRCRAQHRELDGALDVWPQRRQPLHYAVVGVSLPLAHRPPAGIRGTEMPKPKLPRRTPLALLVATLAAAAAQNAGSVAAQPPAESEQGGSSAESAVSPNVETIAVIGRLQSTALDVVGARLEEDVVSDFLGAEAIARVGDSTVSAALRRVPGLTLVNDQFVYVRGLGERYSSVQLNGAQVPSPDLTRNVIPLDIFPTEIIDALQVQKGYAPEQPAAFGGGSIDIRTRGIPNGPVVNIEIGSGTNSDINDEGYAYKGGHDDGLGRDDGTRAFPELLQAGLQTYTGDISPANILAGLNSDGTSHALSEAEAINRDLALSLNRDVEIEPKDLGPDGSLELALGNRWFLAEDDAWRLGVIGLLSYDNVWRNRERVQRAVTDPEALVETKNRTINAVSATGVINLGVSYTDDHEISTSTTYVRNTDDEASISTRTTNNFQIPDGTQLRDYDIRYEQRELLANQIRGHHVIGLDTRQSHRLFDHDWMDGLTLDWYASEATAETDIPNEIKFSAEDQVDPTTGEVLSTAIRRSASAGDFRFTYLDDEVRSSGWDLMKPFAFENNTQVDLSVGQDISDKARSYTQTQFQLGTTAKIGR